MRLDDINYYDSTIRQLRIDLEKAYNDNAQMARWNLALLDYMTNNGLKTPNSTDLMKHLPSNENEKEKS